ncbi:unnamed protein product [Cunninghamella blakesleeana]
MGLFRSHHTDTSYDEIEPLNNGHDVIELEPTTSHRRPSHSSDASFEEEEDMSTTKSKKRQKQKQKRRQKQYSSRNRLFQQQQQQQEQQREPQQREPQQHGYQRLGGQIVEAWHSVTGGFNTTMARHRHVDEHHLTEDEISLYLLLEEPSSSRAAFWTNVVVSFLIVSSAIMTTIETIPAFRSAESNRVWFHLESTMVALFTLEYLLRLFAHSDSFIMLKNFVLAPISIIDFISIVPFYIEVIAQRDTTYEFRFTILRLFRLLRLFKTYKYSNAIIMTIEVMVVALKRSGDALSALFFFLVTCVVLFSTLLYFAERGTWDEPLQTFVDPDGNPSAFDSIPAAFWFVLVTITTTGYGDMVPTTFIGKLVTFPAMMFGVLLIALPSIIVGRNFTIVWESMRRRQYLERLQENQPVDGSTEVDNNFATPATVRRPSSTFDDILGTRLLGSLRPMAGNMDLGTNDQQQQQQSFILDDNDDALFSQLHTLMTITRQNQEDIQRILAILEKRSNNPFIEPTNINTSSTSTHSEHTLPSSLNTKGKSLEIITEE